MESINITKAIFKKIIDFLNNKEMIVKYLIKEINDFNNEDKINFYYIFLKLLKDSIFIYFRLFKYEEIIDNSEMFNNFESQKNEDSSSYCYQEKEPTILKKLHVIYKIEKIFISFISKKPQNISFIKNFLSCHYVSLKVS